MPQSVRDVRNCGIRLKPYVSHIVAQGGEGGSASKDGSSGIEDRSISRNGVAAATVINLRGLRVINEWISRDWFVGAGPRGCINGTNSPAKAASFRLHTIRGLT